MKVASVVKRDVQPRIDASSVALHSGSDPGLVARLIPVDIARRAVAAARGSVRTASKAEAARRNGAKGGRPAKADLALA